MIDFLDPRYLAVGNRRQREVYGIVSALKILEKLKPFSPVMAGTFPIDVYIENSDIDILCEYTNPGDFEQTLKRCYSACRDFRVKHARFRGKMSLVASFFHKGYKIEIFGQRRPVQEQDGFVHMIVEYRILQMCGGSFREEVRRLKREGIGTEPAFARLLGIDTEPYDTLRGFGDLVDEELAERIPDEHLRRQS